MVEDGSGDCDLLFVYGTLRRGFRLHGHLAKLGAEFRSEAQARGELFDLGTYPGARPSGNNEARLHGELFRLSRPAHDLAVLDDVEGFDPKEVGRSQFVRTVTEVTLTNGACCRAWVYWLGNNSRPARRIPSGDYTTARAHDSSF